MKNYFIFLIILLLISFTFISALQNKNVNTPEELTRKYVMLLADGKCEEALDYSIGKAKDMVAGSIEAGCEAYETNIVDITCQTVEDSSRCTCTENRAWDNKGEFREMKFNFDLVRVKKKWKVHYYAKDMGEFIDD